MAYWAGVKAGNREVTEKETSKGAMLKSLDASPWEESVDILVARIKSKVRELKREGTVGMSAANLKQVVSSAGLSFPNPNAFERGFEEALRKAGVGRFVRDAVAPIASKDADRKPTQDDLNAAARGLKMISLSVPELEDLISEFSSKSMFASQVIVAAAKQMRAAKLRVGAAKTGDVAPITAKDSNFSKLEHKLEKKGYSKKAAGGIAYKVGEEKYGKAGMAKKAAAGRRKAKDAAEDSIAASYLRKGAEQARAGRLAAAAAFYEKAAEHSSGEQHEDALESLRAVRARRKTQDAVQPIGSN